MPNILSKPNRPAREPLEGRARQNRLDDEAMSQLVEGYRCGASVNTLAKLHEIHRTTVLAILDRQGVARRQNSAKLDPTAVQLATDLYSAGASLKQVAERFDVNSSTIANTLKRNGVTLRPRRGWSGR